MASTPAPSVHPDETQSLPSPALLDALLKDILYPGVVLAVAVVLIWALLAGVL